MLELIALEIWLFGTLCSWFLAKTNRGQAAVFFVAFGSLCIGVMVAQNMRSELGRLDRLISQSGTGITSTGVDPARWPFSADLARLRELCAIYPDAAGCQGI